MSWLNVALGAPDINLAKLAKRDAKELEKAKTETAKLLTLIVPVLDQNAELWLTGMLRKAPMTLVHALHRACLTVLKDGE